MAEVNLSSEQLNKLKAAMARAKGLDPQAALQQPAARQAAAAGETKAESETAAETAVAVETRKPPTESNLAEGTYLRIDEDEMAAWLYLTPPAEGQTYTKRDLENYLELNGVIKGYHSSNLSAMVKKKVYEREILVARGAETKSGTDGYFEYLFAPEEHVGPKVNEDGSVDYSSMSALQNVHKGDKVAVYHYAVQGVDGYTVVGGQMKADPVRDLPPMRGKGITRENGVYYAQSDGKIEVKDGKIDIQNVHEIMGDVDAVNRILSNLVSNVIRYGSDGKYIGLFLREERDHVFVDVVDRGKGIEKQFAASVFERLYTMEDSRSRSIQGNGLGLTIAKSLANQMGGDVTLASRPGVRTVFTVQFLRTCL